MILEHPYFNDLEIYKYDAVFGKLRDFQEDSSNNPTKRYLGTIWKAM